MTPRNRKTLLLIAGALLLVALGWTMLLHKNSAGAALARRINAYGYTLLADDLYPAGRWENTSIRALLGETPLESAVAASRRAGFASDIDRVGVVALVMAHPGQGGVITLYLLDGEPELCFVQDAGGEDVRALGE